LSSDEAERSDESDDRPDPIFPFHPKTTISLDNDFLHNLAHSCNQNPNTAAFQVLEAIAHENSF
jgi:hypothetical protein